MRVPRLFVGVVLIVGFLLVPSQGASAAPVVIPTVPPGYSAGVYAEGLDFPTSMAFGPDGRLYVSELKGNVIAIEGNDDSGHSTRQWIFSTGPSVSQFFSPLGLAWRGNDLYVSSHNRIYALRDAAGSDRGGEPVEIIGDLKVQGQHQNNGIAFGPDDKLYVTIGSSGNVVRPPTPWSSTILRMDPDGKHPEVFATGLRNPYSLAFDSAGRLWAPDNGADPPQAPNDPDRLNYIQRGKNYGYPDRILTPGFQYETPVVLFPVHASANSIAFYNASLMPELQGRALVGFYGPEYYAGPDAVRQLVTVRLWQEGNTWKGEYTPFATDLDRPLAVAVGPDGRIFVADFGAGAVYWIAPADWTPAGSGAPAATEPGSAAPPEATEPEAPTEPTVPVEHENPSPPADAVSPDDVTPPVDATPPAEPEAPTAPEVAPAPTAEPAPEADAAADILEQLDGAMIDGGVPAAPAEIDAGVPVESIDATAVAETATEQ